MTIERAVEILTPGAARYSPEEYEQALELAREELTWHRFDDKMPPVDEDVLCTDGTFLWTDSVQQGEDAADGRVEYYLDSGNDMSKAWWKRRPLLPQRS